MEDTWEDIWDFYVIACLGILLVVLVYCNRVYAPLIWCLSRMVFGWVWVEVIFMLCLVSDSLVVLNAGWLLVHLWHGMPC